MNYCEFMKRVKKDPAAPVKRMTIREYLELEKHVTTCLQCKDIPKTILKSNNPKQQYFNFSQN